MHIPFSVGSILCDVEIPIKVTSKIQTRIVVFNVQIPITKGFMVRAVGKLVDLTESGCSKPESKLFNEYL